MFAWILMRSNFIFAIWISKEVRTETQLVGESLSVIERVCICLVEEGEEEW